MGIQGKSEASWLRRINNSTAQKAVEMSLSHFVVKKIGNL